MSARSVWFARPGCVELRSEELPELGVDDVRIRAAVSGISHGTEMLVLRGQVPPELEVDLPTVRGSFGFPIKYGYASVGHVTAVGSAVRDLASGDLVFTLHPHQTDYVVPASLPTRLPPTLDPAAGVFLANLETATNIVLDAAPRLGERVVVFGQGVVGLLVTQLLRRTGVGQVIAIDPIGHRRELALRLGADTALAPHDLKSEAIRDLTAGRGADVAIEVSGSPAALDLAIDSVAFGGAVVVASWYGTKPVSLHLGAAFHRRRLRLVSSQVSTIDAALQPRWTHERRLDVARDLLQQLPLDLLVSHRIPVEQAKDAYALVDNFADEVIQVVLTYP